jgi:hypothetical protein
LEEKNRELERLNREIDVLIRKKEAILNGWEELSLIEEKQSFFVWDWERY